MQIIIGLFMLVAFVVIIATLTLKFLLIFAFIGVVLLLYNYVPVVFDIAVEYWYVWLLCFVVYMLYKRSKENKETEI
jgi:4-hydroxybenzoate polyprenyltransferase